MVSKRRGSPPKQCAVLGLGRFGSSVAQALSEMGHEVLAIDRDEAPVQAIAPHVTHAVQASATDEAAMRSLGLRNFEVAIVSIGDIEANILATLILKDLGVRYLVAKAVSDAHGRVLERVGADRVVFPERDMGVRVAHNLVSGNLIDYIELKPGFSLVEVVAKEEFIGKSLRHLDLRARHGISVMAIRRGDEIRMNPGADDEIVEGDILVAMGPDEKLARLESGELTRERV